MVRVVPYATLVASLALTMACPARAGWKLVEAGKPMQVGKMTITPTSDWNQASARPGKQGVAWTQDGLGLNGIEFFAAVPAGQPVYRERSAKRNPMPRFDATMLLPDLVDLFERSFRVQNQVTELVVEQSKPAVFGGHQGMMVRYRYNLPNDTLKRRGIARLAIVDKQLFMGNFYGPELHYFPSGLLQAEAMMDSARF